MISYEILRPRIFVHFWATVRLAISEPNFVCTKQTVWTKDN